MSGGVPRWYRRLKLQHYAISMISIIACIVGIVYFPDWGALILFMPLVAFIGSNIRVGWIVAERREREVSSKGAICPFCAYDTTGISAKKGLVRCPECSRFFDTLTRRSEARKYWGAFRRTK
jgi:hypothetical protein